MRLILDMRIAEDWAQKHLGPNVGTRMIQKPGLPVVTRKIVVDAGDPLVAEIKQKLLESERWGESFFCFVNQDYVYQKGELACAALLRFRPTVLIRTYGERHGTVYDDSGSCSKCGFGRVQRSPLVIDPRYLKKKGKDFLVTITADEWIVSRKLADLLNKQAPHDCTFGPVNDLHGTTMDDWCQLKVHSLVGEAVKPTRFGLDYFHEDTKGEYVCAKHDLSGLNLAYLNYSLKLKAIVGVFLQCQFLRIE